MKVDFATFDQFEGWDQAPGAAAELISRAGARDILEVGSGASPTLPAAFVRERGLDYTTNDISVAELEKAEHGFRTLCLDFSDGEPPAPLHGAFDAVFSRMVNEHVRDGARYYRNIATVLRPGGVSFHWFSTLFALPFLVNRLVPESLASLLLDAVVPKSRPRHKKFPAYYSWGRGPTARMIRRFDALGFDVLEYTGYFGHRYYEPRFPWLHALEVRKAQWLVRHPTPHLTSYARVVLRKRGDATSSGSRGSS